MTDLKFAFRQLLKNPGFTAVAVLALALGIGANTTTFGFVNAVLLRPLPYRDADRLIRIASVNPGLGVLDSRSSHPNVLDWQERSTLFEEIATFQEWEGALTVAGKSISVRVNWVTPNLLPMLGVKPVHGRLLTASDMDSGLLLPYGLWQRCLGGDPAAIGKKIKCDGETTTIVGILPPQVTPPVQGAPPLDQVFLAADIRRTAFPRDLQLHNVVGRLKPGVTVAQAQEELTRVAKELEREYPESNRGWGVKLTNIKDWQTQIVRPPLLAIYAATGIVLLIACLNVSNLLLIRAESRRKELAIRSALGSTRLRLVRQLLSESLLLSLIGGGAGVVLAFWCRGAVLRFAPDSLGIQPGKELDLPVILSATAVTLLAALLSGMFPVLRLSRGQLTEALGETSRSASPSKGRHRLLHALVVGQIAISTVLLATTALAFVSFQKLMQVDPGFSQDNAICFRVDPYPNAALTRRVMEALSSLPGVQSVGGANHELLNDLWSNGVRITRDPQPEAPASAAPTVDYWRVSKDYFSAAGIPLIAGRTFDAHDPYDVDRERPTRVIINEALAKQLFRGENPVGQAIRILPRKGVGAPREIVGVVGSIKHRGLHRADVPMIYGHAQDTPAVTVRALGNPAALLPAIRETIGKVDPELIVSRVSTTKEIVARSLADRHFVTLLMFIFSGLGTLLAALGLYGVTSYAGSQRTQEIGIRMALGAQRGDVLRLVLTDGMRLVSLGIGAGVAAALIVTRGIQGLLFNVSPTDPTTFVAISALLAAIALLACYIPARRATRIDPLDALRHD
jgi:putative ABC transport system permease protein